MSKKRIEEHCQVVVGEEKNKIKYNKKNSKSLPTNKCTTITINNNNKEK